MPGWILQVLTNPYFIIALSVISLGVLAGLDSFQLGLYSQTHFHNLQNIVLLDRVCSSCPMKLFSNILCCTIVIKCMCSLGDA